MPPPLTGQRFTVAQLQAAFAPGNPKPYLDIAAHDGPAVGCELIYTGTPQCGTVILTWSRDGTVYLHNVATGQRVGAFYQVRDVVYNTLG